MNTGCNHNKDMMVRGEWTKAVHCRMMHCSNYVNKCPHHALIPYGLHCNLVVIPTLEEAFTALASEWKKLGADPDDFLKCVEHQELMFDPDNNFVPTWHYQHATEDAKFDLDEDDMTLKEVVVWDENGVQQGDKLYLTEKDVQGMRDQLPKGWSMRTKESR